MIEYKSCVLGDLVSREKKSIISGPFGSNIGKRFFKESGVPVIRGNNLSTNHEKFNDSGFVFITEDKARELNCYAITNDLVFTAVGTIGQVGIIGENQKYTEYTISNKQLRVRLDLNKVLPLYAYYWFSAPWTQKLIFQRNVGSTVPLINLSVAKGLPIELPNSLDIQQRIVDVLESINSKIEVNNKINSELEGMAKLIYDYWFVQFDFPFDFAQVKPADDTSKPQDVKPCKSSGGKMVYNEQLKREIPVGWEVKTINEVITVKDGTHDSPKQAEEGFALITSKHLSSAGIDFKSAYLISKDDYDNVNKRSQVNTGDILFSMIGNIGTVYKVEEKEINFAIKNVALFKTSDNQEIKNYVYQYLRSYDMLRYMGNVIAGSIQKFIGLGSLRNIPFLYNEDVIKSYVERTKPIFQKLEFNKQENQKLSDLRDWLLPMLMNGQVRVKMLSNM